MERKKKWTTQQLAEAVKTSTSVRQTIKKLGLIEAGGNYEQVKKFIKKYKISTKHFRGMAWNKGMKILKKPLIPIEKILVENSNYQSFKLKKRLFALGFKKPKCEECHWEKLSNDGRIPVELDHINGNKRDNRLKNLRILCPNCHSLKPTHRGKNMGQWRNWYTRNT